MRGICRDAAIAFAAERPIRSDPINPGRMATATAVICECFIPALFIAWSMIGMMRSTCAREAISGTTPRQRAWSSS